MSDFFTKHDPALRETYHHFTHSSGMRVLVIPKEFGTEFAGVGVGFGARDVKYLTDGKKFEVPFGCAHFLEHKMFETADGGDAFSQFDLFGGNANAYTSFDSTCFYFSCTQCLAENLRVLLEAVKTASFTEESVKKERDIIIEEIRMYEDSPAMQVGTELMKGMYFSHPVREATGGTVRSVKKINRDILMRCASDFYIPSNMVLAVCTHRDPKEILDVVDSIFTMTDSKKRPVTLYGKEPDEVVTPLLKKTACVTTPLFGVGYKCKPIGMDLLSLKKTTAVRMAISMMFGRASDFYCKNYESKLLNERFSISFENYEGVSYFGIGGSSDDPMLLADLITEELEYRKNHFFGKQDFLREKKAAYASAMLLFDSPEDIVNAYISNSLLGVDEFQFMETLRSITLDECFEAFQTVINTRNRCVSIIEPK